MSSTPTQHVSRPGGVTLLVVLGLIQGIAASILGVVLILDKDDADLLEKTKMSENTLLATGVGAIILGSS